MSRSVRVSPGVALTPAIPYGGGGDIAPGPPWQYRSAWLTPHLPYCVRYTRTRPLTLPSDPNGWRLCRARHRRGRQRTGFVNLTLVERDSATAANEKSGPLRAALQMTLTGVFANSVLPLSGSEALAKLGSRPMQTS